MAVPPVARPPRVQIPAAVWDGSGQLAPFMARLALEQGPIFTFTPQAGPVAGRDVVYMVGPEANRFVLSNHRHLFSHDLGWTPVVGESLWATACSTWISMRIRTQYRVQPREYFSFERMPGSHGLSRDDRTACPGHLGRR